MASYDGIHAESTAPVERISLTGARPARLGQPDLLGAEEIRWCPENDASPRTRRARSCGSSTSRAGPYCRIHGEGYVGDDRYEGEAIVELEFDSPPESIALYRVGRGYPR